MEPRSTHPKGVGKRFFEYSTNNVTQANKTYLIMSEAPVKLYKLILYTAQFAVAPQTLSGLNSALPKLLTRLHITDETTRVNIIESMGALTDDYKAINKNMSPSSRLSSRSSRASIIRFLALFGLLTTAASLRKILTNIKHPLESALTVSDLATPSRYAASASLLASFLPLLRTKIPDPTKSSFLLTAASLSIMPEGYPKDYASIYALFQGLEVLIRKHEDASPLKFASYWILMPICLSQLLQQASTSPSHLPGLIARLFTALYSGFIEAKPVWYNSEWPKTIDTFIRVKKTKRINKGLIHTDVVLTRTNPAHVNAKMSILSPSEASLATVLMHHVPQKAGLLFVISLSIFYATYRFQSRSSDTNSITTDASSGVLSTSAGTSCQDYEELDLNDDIITKPEESTIAEPQTESVDPPVKFEYTSLGRSSLEPSPQPNLRRALLSAGKFTSVTLASVVTSYILLTTRLNPRMNGFISGLWWYAYRETASPPLFAYLARITLLSLFRQKRDTYLKSRIAVLRKAGQWGSTVAGAIGVALLMKMREEGRQISGRFEKYMEFIKTGGLE